MAGSKTNPDNVGGTNEYFGQRVSLSPGLGIPTEAGGLSFDRAEFQSVMGTKGAVTSGDSSQAKPLG
jgi:hypothetical protein